MPWASGPESSESRMMLQAVFARARRCARRARSGRDGHDAPAACSPRKAWQEFAVLTKIPRGFHFRSGFSAISWQVFSVLTKRAAPIWSKPNIPASEGPKSGVRDAKPPSRLVKTEKSCQRLFIGRRAALRARAERLPSSRAARARRAPAARPTGAVVATRPRAAVSRPRPARLCHAAEALPEVGRAEGAEAALGLGEAAPRQQKRAPRQQRARLRRGSCNIMEFPVDSPKNRMMLQDLHGRSPWALATGTRHAHCDVLARIRARRAPTLLVLVCRSQPPCLRYP